MVPFGPTQALAYVQALISQVFKGLSHFAIAYLDDIIVYQMGRLCGGAHEISGIKAQIFLHGWVGVGRGGVVGWVVVWF